MNYIQAEEYLSRFINYENISGISYASYDYDLGHIEELLRLLGNPHLSARTVHVAGTKGKGSVAAMIAQVLTLSGYRTGLYTSPHLHNLRERIKVDNTLISQEEFASLMTRLKPYFKALNGRELTFFEALTIVAFVHFKKKEVDFQVLEVGLGGRLDATNVAQPEVCIITPISREHTQVLGDSLEKITYEKAGIIKPGSQVVLSPQSEDVTSVLCDVCRKRGTSWLQVGKDVTWRRISADLSQQSLVVEGKREAYHLTIPLLGDYQVENAATAVAALEVLISRGVAISSEDIIQGLAQVKWPGRFQIIRHRPVILLDGAHNVASVKRLVENIKSYFGTEPTFLIFGVSVDKDIPGMVRKLLSLSPRVIVTRSSHPRAASPSAVTVEFNKLGLRPDTAQNVSQALRQALSLAGERDLICVTGSLFVVAEALDYFSKD
ncbi:MAG: folylpolyglutamate synthase/dihydrofolate synthase family protein [Chloroflexota bacterium]|nr:folylpolyglutamate synthase/dihydrofolate synthase family protein [Chloroflexota bacterium]